MAAVIPNTNASGTTQTGTTPITTDRSITGKPRDINSTTGYNPSAPTNTAETQTGRHPPYARQHPYPYPYPYPHPYLYPYMAIGSPIAYPDHHGQVAVGTDGNYYTAVLTSDGFLTWAYDRSYEIPSNKSIIARLYDGYIPKYRRKHRPVVETITTTTTTPKACNANQERNPATGRCRYKCALHQERNPATGRCRVRCETHQYRNPKSGRCKNY